MKSPACYCHCNEEICIIHLSWSQDIYVHCKACEMLGLVSDEDVAWFFSVEAKRLLLYEIFVLSSVQVLSPVTIN